MPARHDRQQSASRSLTAALLLAVATAAASSPAPLVAKPAKSEAKGEPKSESKTAKADAGAAAAAKGAQAIVVLVNDEPITGYEIEQRQRMLALSAGDIGAKAQANFKALISNPATTDRLKAILGEVVKANQGKSREQIIAIFEERKKQFAQSLQKQAVEGARSSLLPALRKQALEELIDERLKMQAAKRDNAIAGDEEVEKIIKSIADRNKMTVDQFAVHMRGMGADIASMRARFKSTLSWNDVIRRRFGHMISITDRDIDRAVEKTPGGGGEDEVELQVHRITLPIAKLEQKQVAQRLQEADAARAKFNGCRTSGSVAAGLAGARFEDLGTRKPSGIPEPTRSLLIAARDGDMLPATIGQGGVELWAVCGRTVLKADEAKREQVSGDLRQKEFEVLSRKHLKDLRQDASIEYR